VKITAKVPAHLRKLYEAAHQARLRSYSPYSGKKVGAAIETSSGTIYFGCNVENATYGATCCAERTAIQTAVAHEGRFVLRRVLVLTDHPSPWLPCGICRQVLTEFAPKRGKVPVYALNLKGVCLETSLQELLPTPFDRTQL
jgi:homotetrameric cytidine deaminase